MTKPVFSVYHLRPATRFEATIYSSNRKGRSSPSLLRVSTLKRPSEKRLATTASGKPNNERETALVIVKCIYYNSLSLSLMICLTSSHLLNVSSLSPSLKETHQLTSFSGNTEHGNCREPSPPPLFLR